MPTAGVFIDAFDGWVVVPVDAVSITVGGYGGLKRMAASLRLRAVLAGGEEVELDMHRHPFPDAVRATKVTFLEIQRRQPLRFPVDLRIERSKQTIKVEARRRSFALFTCGDTAFASAAVGGVTVDVLAPRSVLSEIELRRVDVRELRRMLKAYRELHGQRP